jgi:cytochrome P450
MLFATHPEQWDAVRADPSLIGNAINEVLRLESPVQRFTRHVTRDVELDGIAVPAGSRVMVMYASANRDPEQWPDPDVFDVRRPSVEEHMAFGFGEHACIGQHLARIEIRSLLEALASRVVRFDITNAVRNPNQTLRGFNRLDVTLTTG